MSVKEFLCVLVLVALLQVLVTISITMHLLQKVRSEVVTLLKKDWEETANPVCPYVCLRCSRSIPNFDMPLPEAVYEISSDREYEVINNN